MTISTINFDPVNTGTTANDGTGWTLRDSFIHISNNFEYMSNVGFNAANINMSGALVVGGVQVPTLANSTGVAGQITWDSGNIYVCVATNTWKRATISTW